MLYFIRTCIEHFMRLETKKKKWNRIIWSGYLHWPKVNSLLTAHFLRIYLYCPITLLPHYQNGTITIFGGMIDMTLYSSSSHCKCNPQIYFSAVSHSTFCAPAHFIFCTITLWQANNSSSLVILQRLEELFNCVNQSINQIFVMVINQHNNWIMVSNVF